MEDGKILELYFQRDENAIKETSAKYGAYCYSIADNILHNKQDCEECVNDTWINAWNSIPPQRPVKFKLYLAKITRNLSFNLFNSRNTKKRGGGEMHLILDELSECVAGRDNVENEYIAKELGQSIKQFVSTLPERDANVFLRRYFFCESLSEIAKRYALTQNNVTVILSRTRKKLQKHLIKEEYFL